MMQTVLLQVIVISSILCKRTVSARRARDGHDAHVSPAVGHDAHVSLAVDSGRRNPFTAIAFEEVDAHATFRVDALDEKADGEEIEYDDEIAVGGTSAGPYIDGKWCMKFGTTEMKIVKSWFRDDLKNMACCCRKKDRKGNFVRGQYVLCPKSCKITLLGPTSHPRRAKMGYKLYACTPQGCDSPPR